MGCDHTSQSALSGAVYLSGISVTTPGTGRAVARGMKTQTPIEIYKELRAAGKRAKAACYELMALGMSCKDAADLSWCVETGAPAPQWQHEDGSPTQAAMDWARGTDHEMGEQ